MKQAPEAQMWRQVRGSAAAVMCEPRGSGIKWPHWHTSTLEGDRRIDMRYVCPRDVKKMSLQLATQVYWKKWAAKHEYEELKEGIWLEPALALSREKTKKEWTERHRNVVRKLLLETGWVQKLFDTGWSDESKCQACHEEEGTEKHRLCHCREWCEVRREIPEAFRECEQKARMSKKEWKWQRGIVTHPLGMKKWESEMHKSWDIPAEGFQGPCCH